jgi:hypothetical protein
MLKNLADEKEIVEIIFISLVFYYCSDFNYIFLLFKKEKFKKN